MNLNPDNFTTLLGGMQASVQCMSRRDLVHDVVLAGTLAEVVEHEANAHHTDFNADRFNRVVEAVKEGDISAYFILAGWDVCHMRVAGASIEFPTVITEWDGKAFQHYPAIYGEDTCLLSSMLKTLIQERPAGKALPKGLGAFFEQERIRRWTLNPFGDAPMGMTARGRVGEYSAHSSTMIKIIDGLGGSRGVEDAGTILEINGLTNAMKDKLRLPVSIKDIEASNCVYNNIFVTEWSSADGKQQIAASFTKGISTFTGKPITRVQITSNGQLPERDVLSCALASLLSAGQNEIREKRWGAPKRILRAPSPVIAIHGSQQEAHAALWGMGKEMLIPRIGAADDFWAESLPILRVHTRNEPEINAALAAKGAQTRTLGPHPMLPVVIDFKNIPQEAMAFDLLPARPVKAVNRGTEKGAPLFLIAA